MRPTIVLGCICVAALVCVVGASARGNVAKRPRACTQTRDCFQDQVCTSTCSYTTMMCDKGSCKGGLAINCCTGTKGTVCSDTSPFHPNNPPGYATCVVAPPSPPDGVLASLSGG